MQVFIKYFFRPSRGGGMRVRGRQRARASARRKANDSRPEKGEDSRPEKGEDSRPEKGEGLAFRRKILYNTGGERSVRP